MPEFRPISSVNISATGHGSGVCTGSVTPQWFAVYTAPRHEKAVAGCFAQKEIEHFLPLYRTRHRWKDGSIANLELPLFPSYIFVHIAHCERVRVLQVPGVLRFVCAGHIPCPLPDFDMESLRTGLQLHHFEPHPCLVAGQRVRIRNGAMAGMEGVLIRRKSNFRVVLTIAAIMQSVAIEVDVEDIEQLPEAHQ